MNTQQAADERRIAHLLKTSGVGPDAIPPKPTERPRDWLDDILDSNATPPPAPTEPAPAEPEPQPKPRKPKGKPRKRPKKQAKRQPKRAAVEAWRNPRQSLLDAYDRIPPRLKWLGYHASAAYMGWEIGLVGYATHVTAWIAETGLIGVQATWWYGVGLGTVALYRRAAHTWWPVAWLASIPASSVVTGVLLYAPLT